MPQENCSASGTKIEEHAISQADDRNYPEITCPDCGKERVSVSPKMGESKDGLYRITRHLPKDAPRTRSTGSAKVAAATVPSDPLAAIRAVRDAVIKQIEAGPATLLKNIEDLATLKERVSNTEAAIKGHEDRMAELETLAEMYDTMLSAAAEVKVRDPRTIVVDRPESEVTE